MSISYEIDIWSLEQLVQMNSDKKLVLPAYQRSVKWNKEKKRKLIDTMRMGNPIGTFLLFFDSDRKQYQIIDGLQRISTIIDYFNNPQLYLDSDILDISLAEEIRKIKCTKERIKYDQEKLRYQILNDRKDLVDIYKKTLDKPTLYTIRILQHFNLINFIDDNLTDKIEKIQSYIKDKVELKKIQIPIIKYSGNKRDLPKIFTDINKNTQVLTEFEIYAAQWSEINVGEINDILLEKLKNKYDKINNDEDLGFDIDYDRDLVNEKTMNLFEFCFSLSELLSETKNDFSKMFANRDNSAFELISLLLTDQPNYVDLIEYVIGHEGLSYKNTNITFLKSLMESIIEVLKDLSFIDDYVSLSSKLYLNSDYQKFHLFIALFRKKFKIVHKVEYTDESTYETELFLDVFSTTKYSKKAEFKTIKSLDSNIVRLSGFKQNFLLFKRYSLVRILAHTLEGYWSKNRQVNDLMRNIRSNSNVYFENIAEKEFKDLVTHVLKSQVKDPDFTLIRFSKDVQLVSVIIHNILLRTEVYYSDKCKDFKKMEFDHLIPKSILKDLDEGVPISSLMNCWILDKRTNAKKSDKSIDQLINVPFVKADKKFISLLGLDERQYSIMTQIKDLSKKDKKVYFNQFVSFRIETLPELYEKIKKDYIAYHKD
jgi:hypothetical protein